MVGGTLLVDFGFSEGCSNEIITKIPLLVGAAITGIARFRRGDINILGFYKRA